MSKSLKNFITIKQALKEHSARQLRIMFLLQQWDRPMNYSDQTVSDARTKEALFKNFFGAVKALVRTDWLSQAVGYRNPAEDRALAAAFLGAQKAFDDALKNNFDTPGAVTALTDLVSHINKYLEKPNPCVMLVHKAAMFITKMLRMLGVVEGQDDIGFPVGGAGGGNVEQVYSRWIHLIHSR
jgi:cysteinyl-tRNA synthetase